MKLEILEPMLFVVIRNMFIKEYIIKDFKYSVLKMLMCSGQNMSAVLLDISSVYFRVFSISMCFHFSPILPCFMCVCAVFP